MYLTWQVLGTDVHLLCAIGLCEEIGVQTRLVRYGKLIIYLWWLCYGCLQGECVNGLPMKVWGALMQYKET